MWKEINSATGNLKRTVAKRKRITEEFFELKKNQETLQKREEFQRKKVRSLLESAQRKVVRTVNREMSRFKLKRMPHGRILLQSKNLRSQYTLTTEDKVFMRAFWIDLPDGDDPSKMSLTYEIPGRGGMRKEFFEGPFDHTLVEKISERVILLLGLYIF